MSADAWIMLGILLGSKLYMPLSFASMLGGTSTLIGTSVNLIIAGLVVDQLGEELNIFFPTLAGAPTAAVGILFLMTLGNFLLPKQVDEDDPGLVKRRYRADFRVIPESPLDGAACRERGLFQTPSYDLCVYQSCRLSDQSDGAGTREVLVFRLCEAGCTTYARRRHCRHVACPAAVSVLATSWDP